MRFSRALAAAACALATGSAAAQAPALPHYRHIFVIVEENRGYDSIVGPASQAPNLQRLAQRYGVATRFYAEVHPSEGNYVAMLGGDTFGIHDDDAYYCRPGRRDRWCQDAGDAGYAAHTIAARSLVDQLQEHGLSWKAYMESIPAPGAADVRWPTSDHPVPGTPAELYAVKHNGFMNFKTVQDDPQRARRIVGFDVLERDLASGELPNYAHIVPNQCNDMHGREGHDVPEDCRKSNPAGLIARGDRVAGELVRKLMDSTVWRQPDNAAIVITFDENDKSGRDDGVQGCCGWDPHSAANFGGGHIPTLVIVNHGAGHVEDARPYNHYSLLRTTEAAFGIDEYLGHAGDTAQGVAVMAPLFAAVPMVKAGAP